MRWNAKPSQPRCGECVLVCMGQCWSRLAGQIPVMLCDLGLGNLSGSLHTLYSISLPCQSHLTAVATKTSSFSSDLLPSCFLFPTAPFPGWLSAAFGPSVPLQNWLYFLYLPYLWLSLLESLLVALKSLSRFPCGCPYPSSSVTSAAFLRIYPSRLSCS